MYGSLEQGRPIPVTQAADISEKASGLYQLIGFMCATSSSWIVDVYDGVDNTGTLLLSAMPLVSGTPYPMPFALRKGLFFHTRSGSGQGCLIVGN